MKFKKLKTTDGTRTRQYKSLAPIASYAIIVVLSFRKCIKYIRYDPDFPP